jgi:hypothetical protein
MNSLKTRQVLVHSSEAGNSAMATKVPNFMTITGPVQMRVWKATAFSDSGEHLLQVKINVKIQHSHNMDMNNSCGTSMSVPRELVANYIKTQFFGLCMKKNSRRDPMVY